MTERLHFDFSLSCIGEGNGNPLQCSCLENPRDRGAWWAALYGVAQSRTRLKQLSSSSFQFGPFFFLDKVFSFRFTTKLRGRYRDVPYVSSSHTHMACPITSITHQNDMLVTKNGHTQTHQNNPESIICHRFSLLVLNIPQVWTNS